MEEELSERHRQVLGLEKLRRAKGYKEGWLYHLCREKGLLEQLQDLQLAGLIGDASLAPGEAREGSESGIMTAARSPRTMLTVELVPSTSWYSNLRSELKREEWDKLRHAVYVRAEYSCEVCGRRGSTHPVECHEVWHYDDTNHIQKLAGLIALCPACHEAKHIGHASSVGRGAQARAHLARVNNWTAEDVELYLEVQFERWSQRSQYEWTLDLSLLAQFGLDPPGR